MSKLDPKPDPDVNLPLTPQAVEKPLVEPIATDADSPIGVAPVAAPAGRWAESEVYLSGVDKLWAARVERHGECLLTPRKYRFATLVRAIIGQQISTRAARTIDARLKVLSGSPHRPGPILELGEAGVRSAGLSGVKARYVLNLAEAVASGKLPLQKASRWSDDEVIARLTEVKGVGRWTAEMFLIFALNRPDVLPVGDLGVRVGIRDHFDLTELPGPELCRQLAEPWRPHRSIAMWYLWRDIDSPKS